MEKQRLITSAQNWFETATPAERREKYYEILLQINRTGPVGEAARILIEPYSKWMNAVQDANKRETAPPAERVPFRLPAINPRPIIVAGAIGFGLYTVGAAVVGFAEAVRLFFVQNGGYVVGAIGACILLVFAASAASAWGEATKSEGPRVVEEFKQEQTFRRYAS